MIPGSDEPAEHQVLRRGELTILGRIQSASNATFLCDAQCDGLSARCVYKPISGEAALWDFPDGTLADRELASYLISEFLGWNVVPFTIIRDGPAGPGMVQAWIPRAGDPLSADADDPGDTGREEVSETPDPVDLFPVGSPAPGFLPVLRAYDDTGTEVVLMHAGDEELRRMAVFDVLINNADRKGGHVLRGLDGHLYGVDHGVCLHVEVKLRTVLWGWAGQPIDEATVADIARLVESLDGAFAGELELLITGAEVAALRRRAVALLENPEMPDPGRRQPLPWPAF